MIEAATNLTIRCACGQVAYAIDGAPILGAICHCDDCQAAGAELAALPGARPVLDAWRGTPYALYRRDRVRLIRGAELLVTHKRTAGSATNRLTARCCNTALLVRFERGPHWVSVYRDAIVPTPPAMEMRVQTKFQPPEIALPNDIPTYRVVPPRFVGKLLLSRLAMLLPG